MDVYDADKRSAVMRAVRSKDTAPEMRVRRALHAAGLRFRLHRKDLPGKPDIVFPTQKVAIFVHGCFWHQHEGCQHADRPGSNSIYWTAKLDRNMVRDLGNLAHLEYLGWRVLVVWECQTKDPTGVLAAVRSILNA